ncbi:MAG TPA: dienelactone hydrolase family protein [Saprospiraceae bacterium]|nr:dienelactone hydrolase family protein [Saprospiraceae bacterium]HMX88304.1 dienelactone hydrolase family protein [Saprospiraceae bacterium]HMZ40412.1 dienelactone hydrolase family protein [Saprospiraceae bacterium]HNF11329.1 dienelactone hydrolase family protein [Saprospiraceae bacterium]
MKLSIILVLSFVAMISTVPDTPVLKYLVREPGIKSAHPPMLILLHGYGSNEQDLFSFANSLPAKYLIISARAPITLEADSYAWYQLEYAADKPVSNIEQEAKSRQLIIQFIGQLQEKYAVDASEIYLCGFSQGAIMSYSIALTRPDLVKGIAAMSGRLLEEVKPQIAAPEKLKKLQIFISHGTYDNTLPFQYSKSADSYLQSRGIRPVFKQYPAGHEINAQMLHDLVNWLK